MRNLTLQRCVEICEVIKQKPNLSQQELAPLAKVSPATVSRIKRMLEGRDKPTKAMIEYLRLQNANATGLSTQTPAVRKKPAASTTKLSMLLKELDKVEQRVIEIDDMVDHIIHKINNVLETNL